MEVFTIDLTLNLLLPLVVLTYVTTCSSESTDSSIMNLLHTNTPVCDFEISTQRFRLSTVIDLLQQLQIYRFQRCIDGILVVTFKGKGTEPFRSQKSNSKVFSKHVLGFSLYT